VNKILLLIILTILVSCELNIKDFDIKEPKPKLVAYSYAFPDSVPKIYISRNYRVTQEMTFEPVENAHIELYHQDDLLGTLEQENDFYTNPSILLETNKTYRYSFTKDGFPSAEATFYIPDKPLVNKIDSQLVMSSKLDCITCFPNGYIRLMINFNDNPKATDYYSVQVLHKYYDADDVLFIKRLEMESQTPFIEIVEENGIYSTKGKYKASFGQRFFFSDQSINGRKENILVMQIALYNFPRIITFSENDEDPIPELKVYFGKIDQHLFEHVKSKGKYSGTEINDFIDMGIPLAEPASIYTNVSNGLGIVAGTNNYVKTFQLDWSYIDEWLINNRGY
jgi:hypothetical protein